MTWMRRKAQAEEIEYFSLKIQGRGTGVPVADRNTEPLWFEIIQKVLPEYIAGMWKGSGK